MTRLAAPWALLLLPAAAAAAWAMARRRSGPGGRLALPRAPRAGGRSARAALDAALPALRGAALALGVVALARPQAGTVADPAQSRGVDLMVALDVSGSMRAEDLGPRSRLEVARATTAAFVAGRPRDRIGLVAFAGTATTRCPLTLDHALLLDLLAQVDFAPRDDDGTALGMGLATATRRLERSDARSKAVVLLTDGRNNAGAIAPRTAADAAAALGIRVYTIGVGREGLATLPGLPPQALDLDEPLLAAIADATGGRSFRATDAAGLAATFREIDRLETSPLRGPGRIAWDERFGAFLVPAGLLLAAERLLAATVLRRLP